MQDDPKTTPIITALDFPDAASAQALAAQLDPKLTHLKVGKELFTAAGPALVEHLQTLGFNVFLDLKFHDIPNTVAGALRSALALGVWMVNVHASGGRAMLTAAREAIPVGGPTRLIAVTVLTSMDDVLLQETGVSNRVEQQVEKLAALANACELDGVVCSPQESRVMKARFGESFLLVTPGVRPTGSATGDQRRVMSPEDALTEGSDYLVIGRPITAASDPRHALQSIVKNIGLAI